MEDRKDQIIQAAIRRFMHYGFSKTTMNEIAEDTKITKANLYYYYSEKNTLIRDVIICLTDEYREMEEKLVCAHEGKTYDLIIKILELRDAFVRKYYMLHMNENLEWIKGLSMQDFFQCLHDRDVNSLYEIFKVGAEKGEINDEHLHQTAEIYVELMKSLSLMCNISDIISGIPNQDRFDEVLQKQKLATKLFFNGINKK